MTAAAGPAADDLRARLLDCLVSTRSDERVELYGAQRVSRTAQLAEGDLRPPHVTTNIDRGVGVRCSRGDRVGFAYCSSPDPGLVTGAIAQARLAAESADRGSVRLPRHVLGSSYGAQPRGEAVGLAALAPTSEVCRAYADLVAGARAAGAHALDRCEVGEAHWQEVLVDSTGVAREGAGSTGWAVVTVSTLGRDGTPTGTATGTEGVLSSRLEADGLGALGARATRQAVQLRDARRVAGGRMAVVLGPHATAALLGELVSAFDAHAVAAGRSFVRQLLEEPLPGSTGVDLVDDGRLPGAPRSRPWDAEGVPTTRTPLFGGGRVLGLLHDATSAARLVQATTGNAVRSSPRRPPQVAASNVLLGGTGHTDGDLLAMAGAGFFAYRLLAAHSGVDGVTGDLTVTAVGRMIRGGELAEPVEQVVLATSVRDFFAAVRAVGDAARFLPWSNGVLARTVLVCDMDVRSPDSS